MFRAILLLSISSLLFACAGIGGKGISHDAQQQETQQSMQRIEQKLAEMQLELGKTSGNVSELKQVIDATIKQNQPPPPPTVTEVSLDDDPVMGSDAAKVAIVEFSDFQCPYCAAFHERYFPLIKRDYIDTGKVKFVYRDLSLDFHPEAENAAIAANCAGEQGDYYAMHDLLFKKQASLGAQLYMELAGQLKFNLESFDVCTKSKTQKQEVRADLDDAKRIGISGTPVFFIGRIEGNKIVDVQFMEGAQSPVAFSRVIDSILDKSEKVASLPE